HACGGRRPVRLHLSRQLALQRHVRGAPAFRAYKHVQGPDPARSSRGQPRRRVFGHLCLCAGRPCVQGCHRPLSPARTAKEHGPAKVGHQSRRRAWHEEV
ncbi:hypothetical protein LPJ75_003642, partial [Coemansia sp. RSA 2598]